MWAYITVALAILICLYFIGSRYGEDPSEKVEVVKPVNDKTEVIDV